MRVCLFDLDISTRRRAFPNLALMKLSAFHKARGDEVFLNFPLGSFDLSYASCVFSWNRGKAIGLPETVIKGGSALDISSMLPLEIEHLMPDYELYPNNNFSQGFTSRGCIRKCPWCIVPAKEGHIKTWASIYEFWDRRHKKVKLLDNNILASPNWDETADCLIKEQVRVDFNQGLDIRLVNDKVAYQLSKMLTSQLRFAFDSIGIETQVRQGIALLLKAGIKSRHLSFYVLAGFNGDNGWDRMKILQSLNVDVYPMLYKDDTGKEPQLDKHIRETVAFRGGRSNLRKYLRTVGRIT